MRPTRVLIISDTHGFLNPEIASLLSHCDLAVHAGDIGGISVIKTMQRYAPRYCAVRGNNDTPRHWRKEDHALMESIPFEHCLDLPGGTLYLTHGHQHGARTRHERLRARTPQARAIAYGHSHHLCIDTDEQPWVLNPGAAGKTRTYGGGPSCLWLEASEDKWTVRKQRFEKLAKSA